MPATKFRLKKSPKRWCVQSLRATKFAPGRRNIVTQFGFRTIACFKKKSDAEAALRKMRKKFR